jgi:hypothetical protein
MKRALISHLHAAAKERGPGYLEACLKAGRISRDGQWVIFTDQAHAQIRKKLNPNPPKPKSISFGRAILRGAVIKSIRHFASIPFVNQTANKIGLGDLIHKLAGPVGRAIHWPCMKGDGTTDLKPGSPCAKARNLANKVKV